MSLYQLHRCVWDYIRASEVSSGAGHSFDANRYELTDEERKAFETKDVASLYQLKLHPVLLNAFCRAVGFSRSDYREALQIYATPQHRSPRWQK